MRLWHPRPPKLRAKGLYLGCLEKEDLDRLLKMQINKPGMQIKGRKQGKAYIKHARRRWKEGHREFFAVRKKKGGKIVAVIELRKGNLKRVEISWRCMPKYRDSKQLDQAMDLASKWSLDHGARRVWTVSFAD